MDPILDRELIKASVQLAGEHFRYLHTIPEKAFEEIKTTAHIREFCEDYPLDIIGIGMETGLVCFLDAGCMETVALRTDLDAVPTEHGPQHLCGHDAHMASMLGAVHCLCSLKQSDKLTHNVLFIFQPAEEGTRGAAAMLKSGLLEKVPQRPARIFGIHNRPEACVGDIIVHRGPLMSEKSVFRITVTGRPGHASLPHKCVDPVISAASIINGIQTVISRNTDPFQPAICTVNSVRAGDPDTASPETAVLTGYIRSFDHATHEHMENRLITLAEDIAEAYGCACDVKITHMVPAVSNPDSMYRIALRAAAAAAGEDHIIDTSPCLASEDFALFGTELPAFLYWVGSGTPGRENAPWHDPGFRIDERYFETAVPLLCASALICE